MNELLMNDLSTESLKFEISIMESVSCEASRITTINFITKNESVYVESVVSAFSNFIKEIIKKIQEFGKSITQKVNTKLIQVEFKKKCSEFVKKYAKNKTALSGKKIKFIDYIKYKKDAEEIINSLTDMTKTSKTKKWKSDEEYVKWCNKKIDEMLDKLDNQEWVKEYTIGDIVDKLDSTVYKAGDVLQSVEHASVGLLHSIDNAVGAVRDSELVTELEGRMRRLSSGISRACNKFYKKYGMMIILIIGALIGIFS